MELLLKPHHVCLLDDADWPSLRGHPWSVRSGKWKRNNYAFTLIGGRPISMHRLLLHASSNQMIDHINGNGLDNRRKNLRFCTADENQHNRPGWLKRHATHSKEHPVYKGVWLISRYITNRSGRIWEARICWERKQRYIGTFQLPELAALAYDDWARCFHGRFARLNFPEPNEAGVNSFGGHP